MITTNVKVISGSHAGLRGSIKHSLGERIATLGKDGKVTLYFTRKGKLNTISIRVKHLQSDIDLFWPIPQSNMEPH